jgi:hypothetical protein
MVRNGERLPILSGRMQGEAITFSYGKATPAGPSVQGSFQGTVRAGRLEGSLSEAGRPSQPLTGRRLEPAQATNP